MQMRLGLVKKAVGVVEEEVDAAAKVGLVEVGTEEEEVVVVVGTEEEVVVVGTEEVEEEEGVGGASRQRLP